jgi:hypothetical protein
MATGLESVRVMPDMKTLERKLADTRQEVRNLTVMVMNPKYSPEDRELLHLCERSCRAQAKLRRIAIEYQRGLEGLEGPAHRNPRLREAFEKGLEDRARLVAPARSIPVQLVFDFGRRLNDLG